MDRTTIYSGYIMTVKISTIVDNQLIELTYTCDPCKLKRMSIETSLEMFRSHPCTGKYLKPAAIKPFFSFRGRLQSDVGLEH